MHLLEKLLKVTNSIIYTHKAPYTDLPNFLHSCGVNKTSKCPVNNTLEMFSTLRFLRQHVFLKQTQHRLLRSHRVKSGDLAG